MEQAKWIWLPESEHPQNQTTVYSIFCPNKATDGNYTVAKFFRTYRFSQKVKTLTLSVSGDTVFLLKCNGKIVTYGPTTAGSDYGQKTPSVQYFSSELQLEPNCETVCLEATVQMMPQRMCEFSRGHGGFFLSGTAYLQDGSAVTIVTDENWDCQQMTQYVRYGVFDQSIPSSSVVKAASTDDIWKTEVSQIPCCDLDLIYPDQCVFSVKSGQAIDSVVTFDRIYAGYLFIKTEQTEDLSLTLRSFELDPDEKQARVFSFRFREDTQYEGLNMLGSGGYRIQAENNSGRDCSFTVGLIRSCYPVSYEAKTLTSDAELNAVLELCSHSLRYCRQYHHLDSPGHCEGLSDPGDYNIMMHMTAFSFGDQRLSLFDLRRIGKMLESTDGVMFHTSYALIWVTMLYDTYMYTGDLSVLQDCLPALQLLLNKYESYLGDNGLIETPPDYMFIDWLFIDGLSAHHPPKALGQTCMNLFYFGTLKAASNIYAALNKAEQQEKCENAVSKLSEAILSQLYDPQRQLFFEGLNTPTPEHLIKTYMPKNVDKRYFRRHANILAAYYGILSKEETIALLERIYQEDSLGEVQPYFMHYWLEAIRRAGHTGAHTLPLLNQWKASVAECSKGLVEGFWKPEPTYAFDHSHAWAGTPLYALPMALTGLEILEPGYKKIRLRPTLLGLEWATVEIPTPFGIVTVSQTQGQSPKITAPAEIQIVT